MSHPSERFRAPGTITAGETLKGLLGPAAVRLLAESFTGVVDGFDAAGFTAAALRGLADLELKPRAAHIAAALAPRLGDDPGRAPAPV
ncbi:MAG: hypothetical protein RLZZ127_2507, partial [Planctomycetota bacterium]